MKTISLAALRAKGISLICKERCPSLKISKFYIGVPGFFKCKYHEELLDSHESGIYRCNSCLQEELDQKEEYPQQLGVYR